MPKIAPQKLSATKAILEDSFLTGAGFLITEPDEGQAILLIQVRDYPDYWIKFDRIAETARMDRTYSSALGNFSFSNSSELPIIPPLTGRIFDDVVLLNDCQDLQPSFRIWR